MLSNLYDKYPWIVKWCKMMGSHQYYLEDQLKNAHADKAPATATFFSVEDNRWHTVDEVKDYATRYNLGLDQ